jgi:cytochrome bd-type quinol oxidase subunit 2
MPQNWGSSMSAIELSLLVGSFTLGGGVAGLFLQKLLPEQHTSDRSRDMLGAIVGLTSLLLALVLGTLVGSAYSFYANQKSEMETLAARSLQLDLSLAQYGDDALPLRRALRSTIAGIDGLIWGARQADAEQFTAAAVLPTLRGMVARLAALTPTTDGQKQLLSTIGSDEAQIQQTRLLMFLQLASPISWPLFFVVASWSVFLFCGFGLLSRLNATTLAALGFGSFAIASAIFLILELNEPYSGLFRIPSAPIEQTMEALRG